MATTFRFNGNMGYKKMTDKQYKSFVETIRQHHNHYARSLKHSTSKRVKFLLWLRLMGLIETCDVSNDR